MDFPAGHPFILFNLESKKKSLHRHGTGHKFVYSRNSFPILLED